MHGAHGVMVNTEVCGTFDSGSTPDGHPRKNRESGFFSGRPREQNVLLSAGGERLFVMKHSEIEKHLAM